MSKEYGPTSSDGSTDNSDSKGKKPFRLLTFASSSTLRDDDFEAQKITPTNSFVNGGKRLVSRVEHITTWVWPTGWRAGVYACITSCVVSLLVNLILTIAIVSKYGVDDSGRLTLYHGNCETSKNLNTGIHIFINAMSTIILSSSNYVQQVLCAVTREEVDAAHAGKRWAKWGDIGVPSLLNIFLIDARRLVLWCLLIFSSLPLHLFYNSAVFSSTTTFGFPIVTVNNKWLEAAQGNASLAENAISALDYAEHNRTITYGYRKEEFSGLELPILLQNGHQPHLVNGSDDYLRFLLNSDQLAELTPAECINSYGQNFVTSRGSLLIILDIPEGSANKTNSTLPIVFDRAAGWAGSSWCKEDRFAWVCDQLGHNPCGDSARSDYRDPFLGWASPKRCDGQLDTLIREHATDWRPTVADYPVAKCLSHTVPQRCKVQASIHLMLVVLFLNTTKAVIMYLAIRWMRNAPLLTIGDAVASFLDRPDQHSKNMCLISRREVVHDRLRKGRISARPRPFVDRRQRWHSGAGLIRSILLIIILISTLATIAYLYGWGLNFIDDNDTDADLTSQWSMGWGNVNPSTIISFESGPDTGAAALVWSSFIANVPQLILSIIYFIYNGILTAYFLGVEWQSYMHKRKSLRVSDVPRGAQRTTYFLELPYRAAIPLMIVSGLLHWLVSQSIFLVNIESLVWDSNVRWQDGLDPYVFGDPQEYWMPTPNMMSCGFSPIPMIFVMIIAAAMVLCLIVLGAQKHKSNMPVASSNSLAIAAACHLPEVEVRMEDVPLRELHWGVVSDNTEDGVDHCCFSSLDVKPPQQGHLYA